MKLPNRIIYSLCFLLTLTSAVAAPLSSPSPEQILHEQEAAWNRGDGDAWASAFAPDADLVSLRGLIVHGRKEIARVHAQSFNGALKGSHATVTVRLITQPTPDLTILDADFELTHFPPLPPPLVPTTPGTLKIRVKYILTRQAGEWRIISAQNTVLLPPASSITAPPR